MEMSSRRTTRMALVVMLLVAGAATIDGVRTWRQQRWNALIAGAQVPADAKDVPAQVRFAQAHALAHAQTHAQAHAQAASGAADAALNRYRSLQDDSVLGRAARYNSANLLMRQAIVVRAGTQPGQAIALIELAKEMYRDVLRADPQHWDARYNLERAQRLLADPDDEADAAPPEAQPKAERAATTMRGYSPGLP